MYVPVPPIVFNVIQPGYPEHAGGVISTVVINSSGSVITISHVIVKSSSSISYGKAHSIQPLISVTVTVYVPGHSPDISASLLVKPSGPVQLYVYVFGSPAGISSPGIKSPKSTFAPPYAVILINPSKITCYKKLINN